MDTGSAHRCPLPGLPHAPHFPWRGRVGALPSPGMTRVSIEFWIRIFLVALIATFVWVLSKVAVMLGLF